MDPTTLIVGYHFFIVGNYALPLLLLWADLLEPYTTRKGTNDVKVHMACITQPYSHSDYGGHRVGCNSVRILVLRIVSIAFSFLNGMLHIPTSSHSSSGSPFGQLTAVGVNHIWLKFLTRRDEYVQMTWFWNYVVSLQKIPTHFICCFYLLPHMFGKGPKSINVSDKHDTVPQKKQ